MKKKKTSQIIPKNGKSFFFVAIVALFLLGGFLLKNNYNVSFLSNNQVSFGDRQTDTGISQIDQVSRIHMVNHYPGMS